MPSKLEKIMGCFYGVMLGDTIGMPWEMMSHAEIFTETDGLGVTRFSNPIQKRINDTVELKEGDTTDDWGFTVPVAESIIACRGFNLCDSAKRQITAMINGMPGCGKSSRDNFLVLKGIFHALEGTDIFPRLPKPEELLHKGNGNGVAIKISSLAIYFNAQPLEFFKAVKRLALLTHKDPQAYLSAYVLGRVIAKVYQNSIGLDGEDKAKEQIAAMASEIILELNQIENKWLDSPTKLQANMIKLGQLIKTNEIQDAEIVTKTLGTSCYCAQSIPFAIAMALANLTDFRAAVLNTVNCGGDTDSNASMVGAIVGANLGVMAIPEDWRAFRPEYVEPGQLAAALFSVMNNK